MIAEIVRLALKKKGGHVMFTVHRKELIEQIKQSFINNDVDLERCTILTVGKIAKRLTTLAKPTLIITDETHHSLAQTYKKIYDYYSDIPRLGFTASPWRMNGNGLGDVYESMIEGSDVKWLIDNKYLSPFKYYSINLIDDKKLKKSSTGDYSNRSIDEAIGNTIFGDVVKQYQELANGKQAIVYCHSIEFSKQIVKQFNEDGIKAKHADSKTPTKEREDIMNGFKNKEITILSNVDLISEGFNVPDCSVVIMLRPTESLVLDIQQSMRGMRYKPNKQSIIIDHVGNYIRHGLPDSPRKWTLENRSKKKSTNTESISITQCSECFGIVPSGHRLCPLCGFEFEIKSSEINEEKDTKLEEIKNNFNLETNYIVTKKVNDLKTYEELTAYAKAKRYKSGWIYHQAKLKKLIK